MTKFEDSLITWKAWVQYNNMDEKRKKIKKYIEDSDIPEDLKSKELQIVNDMNLSTPEVEVALAKLIGEEFDKKIANAGIDNVPPNEEVNTAFKKFEEESQKAQQDLESDMKIVDDTLQVIQQTSDEIQKVALRESLSNKN